MLLDETYDVAALPVSDRNFEPLPAGWYTATISDAQIVPTKMGNGKYIKIRYDISGPTHQGRVVFGNLNVRNPNPKAEEIGRQQVGEIMRAIGLTSLKDTDQMIGGNLSIKLDIRISEQYGNSNEVRGFKSLSGGAAPAPKAAPSVPAAGVKAAPPWAKK
jgi:hypothetical protein